MIYKPDFDRVKNGEVYGEICEIIGDIIIFSDLDNLVAYDIKNNRTATLCAIEDVSYSGTDNETMFAFCRADVNLIDGEFYTTVYVCAV